MKVILLAIGALTLAILLVSVAPSATSQNANSSTTSQNANSSSTSKNTSRPGQRTSQERKVIELKAAKGTTSHGEGDPNIKDDKQTNPINAKKDAPSSKGGPRTRGGGNCEVRLDNWTNYLIKIYVDGIYRGVLDRYGDAVVYVGVGETRVYARADFDDGSYLYWGPKTYDCGSNQYIYFKMTE
jgi:hypothetical protein